LKVLLDRTVFEDVIRRRTGWVESLGILHLAKRRQVDGWINALTKPLLYSTAVQSLGERTARQLADDLTASFSEIPLRRSLNREALHCPLPDYLDNIQFASAMQFQLDAIISRNKQNYEQSFIPVFSPEEFMALSETREHLLDSDIPLLDLKIQHHDIYNEVDDRITDIITNTAFILGKHVEEFEKGFAEIQEAEYCLAVSTGTDALHIALLCLGIGPGDAVMVPVNTFIATAEAVSLTGAIPIFVDCDEHCTIDVDQVCQQLLNGKTRGEKSHPGRNGGSIKAIIPVHLYGQAANMDALVACAEEFGLAVVEDCCQAHAAKWKHKKVGNFGEFGAFSFYPGKNLGAYGEGGALVTNDRALFEKAKMIRQHGETQRYHHQLIGHNYRMEAIQGAVLSAKLPHLQRWTERRRGNAQLYDDLLQDVAEIQRPLVRQEAYSVYHLYVLQADDRDGLQRHLQANGIGVGLHYPIPLHLQPAYSFLAHLPGDFPRAESYAKTLLSLPMYPELNERQIRYVVDRVKQFYARKRG
jgi:dTDP-4-amino-4,6-dideoxygalactose transaminase